MKKILIFLVGGTICTEVNNNVRSINSDAGTVLTSNFYSSHPEYPSSIDLFEESVNFGILSENMTVEKWNLLIDHLIEVRNNADKYSGVVIAHGTDTLAYSSALFSLLLNSFPIPVFFVSSNEPLTSPRTNGNANFKVAVECILNGIYPGVYVTYYNPSDNQMYLHLGSQLKQCKNYEEDFYSKGAIPISIVSSQLISALNVYLHNSRKSKYHDLIDRVSEKKLQECILYIKPYVGLNYNAFNYSIFKAVFHGTYHSGTACVEKTEKSSIYSECSILKMLDLCDAVNVPVYYSPSLITGEVYDTIPMIANHKTIKGIKPHFIYGMTNEMTYIKLLVAYSLDYTEIQVDEFLTSNICAELM